MERVMNSTLGRNIRIVTFVTIVTLLLIYNVVLYQRINKPSQSEVDGECSRDERLQLLTKRCADAGRKYRHHGEANLHHMIVDDKHKLVWCNIPKAASSYIFKLLLVSSGCTIDEFSHGMHADYFFNKYGLRRLDTFTHAEVLYRLKTYFKFVVVRHPFDRLVSAWNDKLVFPNPLYGTLSKKIAKTYRRSANTSNNDKATFAEFVRFLNESGNDDDHWRTYDAHCHPCDVTWDAILKTETMDIDIRIILEKLGRDLNDSTSNISSEKFHGRNSSSREYSGTLPELLSLRKSELLFLQTRYRHDLELFGYNWWGDMSL